MHRQVLAIALLASTGCGQEAGPQPAPSPEIQPEAPYRIISDRDEGPTRREVEVVLRKKVTPERLREIALEVKSKEDGLHERTAIFYYLPTGFRELEGQPWAYTHFKPALDAKILGLTEQEADALRKVPLEHKGKRIGAWLQDNQNKTLDLIYDDGSIKIAEFRSPTERSDSDMIELPSPNGRKFKKAKGSNVYEIDYAGNLRIFNAEGQILSAAKPMR